MKRLLSIVAVLGLTGLGIASAQQTPSSTQSPSSSQTTQTPSTTDQNSSMPSSATSANSSQAAKAFQGKIEKSGDKLVLKDSASGTSYHLDDQDKAKQFQDQNVKVMGTLDSATNTVHVSDISPATAQ